jgi:hypothetical protein
MTVSKIIEEVVNKMCDKYCKYADYYNEHYSDEDIATEKLCKEYCDGCPLNKLL